MKEVKEIFNKTSNSIIISSVLAFIVGLIIVLTPEMTIKTISMITAIYIILHGILLVVLDIKATKYYLPFDGLLSGILFIVLGIFLLSKPDIIPMIFTIALGVWITLSSINIIKLSLTVKNDYVPWYLLLLLGILDLIAGLIVIFNPFEASMSIALFTGMMIMIHSVITIVDMIFIKKDVKNLSKAIESEIKSLK